ncbi:MAG: nucleotidyltransferase family protein [Myxococcota bacterium]
MTDTSVRAMILAAGFGTRLGPITQQRPKPMLPVCGSPLVRWAVGWLVHHGVRDIAINLHHLGEQIEAELGDGSALGARIQYSPEHGQILGTGGGLRQARPLIDAGNEEPIVIVNGKILVDLDLGAVLDAHRKHGGEATMVLRPDPEGRWGRPLRLDADNRLVELVGERSPSVREPVSGPLMFTGVHVVQPRFLDRIPPEGEQCVVRTAYRAAAAEGQVYGVQTDRYWWEHSTPERYRQGVDNVLEGRVDLPYAEHHLQGVHPEVSVDATATVVEPVWVGAGARIGAGATVGPHVQLGQGSVVESGVRVRRSVVWDGITVSRDVEDEVVVVDAPRG